MPFTRTDVDRLARATVRDEQGDRIGTVGQVYVDADGAPVWASVRTGFFGTSESFVPLDAADFAGDDLRVPFGRDVVKGAPRVDDDGELDERETEALYDYYDGHRAPAADEGRTARRDEDVSDREGAAPRADAEQGGFITRSEERLTAGTRTVETGRARLRKHVVTEQQTVTVAVTHEEATLVREPIPAAEAAAGPAVADLSEEEHVVVLHGEQVVTSTRTVPVERVRLGVEQVVEQQRVTGEVRREQVDLIEPDGTSRDRATDGRDLPTTEGTAR